MGSIQLHGVSSMATRHLLADAAARLPLLHTRLQFEAMGGVQAAQHVATGVVCDLVVLAADALQNLAAQGHVVAASVVPIAHSPMAIAAPQHALAPDVRTPEALRSTLVAAQRIAYSTGPSGSALMALLQRWGLYTELSHRLVQTPPGVPVASLLATHQADIGFQQLSELQGVPGVEVLGCMPAGLAITTTFSGAVATSSVHPREALQALQFLCGAQTAALKQAHGLIAPQEQP